MLEVKKSKTTEALLNTVSKYEFNHVLVAACWMSLGKLVRGNPDERSWLEEHPGALEALVDRSLNVMSSPEISTRELANIAYGTERSFIWRRNGMRLFTEIAGM